MKAVTSWSFLDPLKASFVCGFFKIAQVKLTAKATAGVNADIEVLFDDGNTKKHKRARFCLSGLDRSQASTVGIAVVQEDVFRSLIKLGSGRFLSFALSAKTVGFDYL